MKRSVVRARWFLRGFALASAMLFVAFAWSRRASAKLEDRPDVGLARRSGLSELARRAVANRMQRHATEMGALMQCMLRLQYDGVADATGRILSEPKLARPPAAGGEAAVNAEVPDAFFFLQDELYARAQEVQAAAREHDDDRLSRGFGRLAETCVSCHSVYLTPPPPGGP